ncbi:F-box only protein 21-like [Daphnia pulicaria]|uniref:F-box only protein 21-like n=1 Tax=Daphnia pulicaria TaxID=35523 RepID=UPI001EECE6AB|nr:F-box only protein 21-like [Daphnia pulicaria]
MELVSFSNEVLHQIFLYSSIDIKTLISIMSTCHRLHNLVRDSNDLWRRKFKERWTKLYSELKETSDILWFDMVVWRFKVVKNVKDSLEGFSSVCYPVGQPPHELMDYLISHNYLIISSVSSVLFIEDELTKIIHHQTSKVNENLTSKNYARKVLQYLRSQRIQSMWLNLMSRPNSEKSLLEGAVLIAQWGQIEKEHLTSLQEVEKILDNIVLRTRQLVHINGIVLDPENRRTVGQVLKYVNQVLYEEMGFKGNTENYYAHENSYIDKVLETRRGIPITLCIIYHEVAKRMGILCEPVSFPQHFLLRWREYPEREAADSYTFIDAFNQGASHQPRSCPAMIGQPRQNIRREAYAAVPAEQVFQRMVNNLIQCSRGHGDRQDNRRDDQRLRNQLHFSRLACVISPGQTPSVVAYAELAAFLGIYLEDAIKLLQSRGFNDEWTRVDFEPGHWERVRQITLTKCTTKLSEQQFQTTNRVACHRPQSMRFAVGLVMNYCCFSGELLRTMYTCVIVSWDAKCQATDEWVSRMTRNLIRGRDQPFYYVLTEDGNAGYVAEDDLELHPEGVVINHADIGLHFESFDGRRYVPNAEKRAEYPDDEAVALSLIG